MNDTSIFNFINLPMWEKMYYILLIAGVIAFTFIMDLMVKEAKSDYKGSLKALRKWWHDSMVEHHKFVRKYLSLLLVITLIATVPNYVSLSSRAEQETNEWHYIETKIVRVNADNVTANWASYPADGCFYNKTFTNDSDTTYIYTTTAWALLLLDFDTFTANSSLENKTYELILWVVAKPQFAGISKLMVAFRSDSGNFYDTSMMVRRSSASAIYHNYTLRSSGCPWTGVNWTETTINQIYVGLWSNGVGYERVTEIGLIIKTITPTEKTYSGNSIMLILMIALISVGLIAIPMLIYIKRG